MWFKARYVGPIVRGEKRDTIRRLGKRPPVTGAIVPFSVGPRKPFAMARITDWVEISASDLPNGKAASVQSLIGEAPSYVLIEFEVLEVFRDCPDVIKALAEADVDVALHNDQRSPEHLQR